MAPMPILQPPVFSKQQGSHAALNQEASGDYWSSGVYHSGFQYERDLNWTAAGAKPSRSCPWDRATTYLSLVHNLVHILPARSPHTPFLA